ncbi:MAG: NUDIX hydrolase [Spirosomataceae bacterium]
MKKQEILTPDVIKDLITSAMAESIQKLVVGAVIQHGGRYLVLRRTATDFLGGLVELPSGGVDPQEPLLTALAREIKEETSLEVTQVMRYLSAFDYKSSSGKRARQFNFLVSVSDISVKLNPQEHDWYGWIMIPSMEFNELNISAHTREVLLQAIPNGNGKV